MRSRLGRQPKIKLFCFAGEAELVALVKASTEWNGMQQLASEWELKCEVAVFGNSSAALSVTKRKGLG